MKRRRVIRVLVLYAVVGWIVTEVASVVLPALHLPPWALTLVIVLVALGFPIALALAWAVDIGPGGLQRTAPLAAAAPVPPAPVDAPVADPAPQARVVAAAESQQTSESRRTIAVLPFVNMSGDAENEYFSDGISEEILNLLTKLPQLKVSSRTSSFNFKGKEVNIPTVARELGVSTVLEGSVRRAGERVRITAQLIETDSDSHLWSETYDREMKDVFAIQDDIARSIVDALQVTLSPKERRALQNVATANASAYDFYLKGRKYFYLLSRRDFLHAIRMYEQAIELDPKYALAHAGLADAYAFLYRYSNALPENLEHAERSSQKAVELDPDSPEAHAARGTALMLNKDYAAAEREFETAILLNPNLYESYYFYGRACMAAGNVEKAARMFQQAAETNPADYQSLAFLGQAYEVMGRPDAAKQALASSMTILEQHLSMNPDDSRALCFGAVNLAEMGQRERAVEWTERALDAAGGEAFIQYNSACAYAVLGDTERALDLLERAVDLGWGDRAWIEHDSDLASLRDNPRFAALLQRMARLAG
ncbi:MAG: tetratricopeptide repeat protein [Luteimonas sp.]